MVTQDESFSCFSARIKASLIADLVEIQAGRLDTDIHCLASRIAAISVGVSLGDPSAVAAVKEWRGCLTSTRFKSTVVRGLVRDWFRCQPLSDGQISLFGANPSLVSAFNKALLLFWKLDLGFQRTDSGPFKNRIRKSGVPCLTDDEAARIKHSLRLRPCPPLEVLIGKNGPGAVAESIKGAQKWTFTQRPRCVPQIFFRASAEHDEQEPPIEPVKYGITRALQVPKDVRGPRYISCEPLAFQHAQFAYERLLVDHIHSAFRRHVTLFDQRLHNRMLWEDCATIDLSDASDYLSRRLYWRVLPHDWRSALFGVRSSFVRVDESIVPLRAFAPMGSALCFPCMTLVIAGAMRAAGLHRFHVYGDDLIVPRRDYSLALAWLEKLGAKVNFAKSSSNGLFVESCGVELFDQVDITPIYLRRFGSSAVHLLNLYQGAIKLYDAGLTNVADSILRYVRSKDLFRSASLTDQACFGRRWNWEYQRLEYRWPTEKGLSRTDKASGYPGIHRWLCTRARTAKITLRASQTRLEWYWLPSTAFNGQPGTVSDVREMESLP